MTADDIGKYTEGLGRTSLATAAAFTKRHLHSGGLGEAEAAMLEVVGDQYLIFSICLLHRRVLCRVISENIYGNLQSEFSSDFPQTSSSKQAAIATQPSIQAIAIPQP
jgi:hypothetical protein